MVIFIDFGNERTTSHPIIKYWDVILQVIGASLFIALCSQIKIVLPFSPIPITLQTFAVLAVGATLGSKKGVAAVLLYFTQILMGLPVMSGGGVNPMVFVGPTGGYVMGFLIQAYCMGWVAERMNGYQPLKLLVGGVIACTLQLGLGALQLASFGGWSSVMLMGVYPFILGEILKVIALCSYMKTKKVNDASY